MSKVYITQEVSAVDYTPAIQFGDLVFVTSAADRLSNHHQSLNNGIVFDKISQVLKDFAEDDYLVCTGAPVHMALCGSILGARLKKVLVWDNREFKYFEIIL
jgi:hypothetical protein